VRLVYDGALFLRDRLRPIATTARLAARSRFAERWQEPGGAYIIGRHYLKLPGIAAGTVLLRETRRRTWPIRSFRRSVSPAAEPITHAETLRVPLRG